MKLPRDPLPSVRLPGDLPLGGPLPSIHAHQPGRRRMLGCCAAAAAGLFGALLVAERGEAATAAPGVASATPGATNATAPPLLPEPLAERVRRSFEGLDASAIRDTHAHLLGVGDGGTGCRIHANMTQGFNLVERLRRRFILDAAGVDGGAPGIDQAYVARLLQLAQAFPAGAKWLLFAFDDALDDAGRHQADWTTFHVPDAYAAQVAEAHPQRFDWVASIHPYREDALTRLQAARARGAAAVKWLPSAQNIDLRDRRALAFCEALTAARLPLIVHCGEEKAVPGAGQDALVNPLLVRGALERGTTVIVAHCASLGQALDLDQKRPEPVPAFQLFARLMDEPRWQGQLRGDVSGLFQSNREAPAWQAVLRRADWHPRLMNGSDYPLPGLSLLFRLGPLVRAGVLDEASVEPIAALRRLNPLLADWLLKRELRFDGQRLAASVFETRRHFGG